MDPSAQQEPKNLGQVTPLLQYFVIWKINIPGVEGDMEVSVQGRGAKF